MDYNILKFLCGKIENKKVFNEEALKYVLKIRQHLKVLKLGELVQLTEEQLLSFTIFSVHIIFDVFVRKINECLFPWGLKLGMKLDERLKMLIAKSVVKPPNGRKKAKKHPFKRRNKE